MSVNYGFYYVAHKNIPYICSDPFNGSYFMESPTSNKPLVLSQSNIITTARYELTKMEKNLLYLAMREMKPGDPPGKLYYVSMVELRNRTNEEVKYDRLRGITKKMLSRVLEAVLPNGDLLQTGFFSSVQYITGTGTLEIGIDPKLRPYYGYLKSHFTTFELDLALTLSSIYGKRMYEIFSMYKNMENKTFRITVDELKRRLGLLDPTTGKEKHPLYADFKRSVLEKAKEINTATDLAFKCREIKLGRKVVELEFTVIYTPKTVEIDFNEQDMVLFTRLTDKFLLRRDQAIAALQKHAHTELSKLLYKVQLLYKDGKIKNIGSYTAEALGVK